jgi:hypothetical protein
MVRVLRLGVLADTAMFMGRSMTVMKAMEFTDALILQMAKRQIPSPQAGEVLVKIPDLHFPIQINARDHLQPVG